MRTLFALLVVGSSLLPELRPPLIPPPFGCGTFDFTTGQQGWTVMSANATKYTASVGWEDDYPNLPWDSIYIKSPVLSDIEIISVTFNISAPWGGSSPRVMWGNYDGEVMIGEDYTTGWTTKTINGSFDLLGTTGQVFISLDSNITTGYTHFTQVLESITINCTNAADPYLPVKSIDIIDDTGFNPDVASTIWTEPDSLVYAPFSGTVTGINQSEGTYTVSVTSGYYHAIIGNLAAVYPAIGETVTASCVLGITGPQVTPLAGRDFGSIDQISNYKIDNHFENLDWTDDDEPTGSTPCGTKYKRDECLTRNPDLYDYALGWTIRNSKGGTTESSTVGANDITLRYGDQIFQSIVLTPSDPYYVTIVAGLVNAWQVEPLDSDELTLTLGEETGTVTVDPIASENVVIEWGPVEPDTPDASPDVFTLTVENLNQGTQGIYVTFICVHTGTLAVEPANCYFSDPEVTQPEAWGESAGAEWANYIPFELGLGDYGPRFIYDGIRLESDEYLYNSITLPAYDDATATYYLDVKARFQAGLSDNAPLEVFTDAPSLEVMYEDLELTETVIDTYDITNVILYRGYRYTLDVLANTPWEGNLYLTNVVTDPPNTVVEITHVCLSPEGGIWPGFTDPILGTAQPGRCEAPTRPTTINPGEWISFLTSTVKYIWYCEAASWLAAIRGAVMGALHGIGMLGRYLGGVMAGMAAWLMATLEVLGAALAGALMGSLETVINDLLELYLLRYLWDLLTLMISTTYDLLGVLEDLFTFVMTLVGAVIALADLIASLWAALVGAINASTTADIGYPVCADPEDPLIAVCWGVDAVDNVVQMLPALQIGGLLIAGAMAVYTIVWTMRQVGQFMADS